MTQDIQIRNLDEVPEIAAAEGRSGSSGPADARRTYRTRGNLTRNLLLLASYLALMVIIAGAYG